MPTLTPLQALSAAAAIMLLAGCSGGSAIAPKPAAPRSAAHFVMSRVTSVPRPLGQLAINPRSGHRIVSHYACPATGSIKYVSDWINNVINVYVGKFAGQAPCGQITSGISNPDALYIQTTTHDLYVANQGGLNVLVFHRGQTTPYNTYTDPSVQEPVGVTVAKDGTLIASNILQLGGPEAGSISTWIEGRNGGHFVGNFPMTNDFEGLFVTVQRNGTVYYNDIDASTGAGALWSLSCPAGECGPQSQIPAPPGLIGGLGSDATDDLLANDRFNVTADTFELPDPKPSTFPLAGDPVCMALNKLDHHWFIANAANNNAGEYIYPGGRLVGTVPGNPGGLPLGIAVDPGHTQK